MAFPKIVLNKIFDKHISKKTTNYQFQPPWFDADCEKILHDKEKWMSKANSETGTAVQRKTNRNFVN